MHAQVSDHFAGNGTCRVLLFAGIIFVLRYIKTQCCFSSSFGTTEITECQSLRFTSTFSRICYWGCDWSARLLARIRLLDPKLLNWGIFNVDCNTEVQRESDCCTWRMDKRSHHCILIKTQGDCYAFWISEAGSRYTGNRMGTSMLSSPIRKEPQHKIPSYAHLVTYKHLHLLQKLPSRRLAIIHFLHTTCCAVPSFYCASFLMRDG